MVASWMHAQSSRLPSHPAQSYQAKPLSAQQICRQHLTGGGRGRPSSCRQLSVLARPPARGPQLLCRCAATAAAPPQQTPVAEARLDAQVWPSSPIRVASPITAVLTIAHSCDWD